MNRYETRKGNVGAWLSTAVTRNPEGLLLLAAGAALLMRGHNKTTGRASLGLRNGSGQDYGKSDHNGPGFGEELGDTAKRAGEYVSAVTDKVAETARSYASSTAEYVDEVGDAAWERSRRMADQARETTTYVSQEQPWAVALAGLAAGATIAAIFPPTRVEKQALGSVGDRLRSAAGAVGDQIMQAGRDAGEKLSNVAKDHGFTTEGLKEAAQEVGETLSSALSGEASNLAQATSRQRPSEAQNSPQSREAQSRSEGREAGNRPTSRAGASPNSGGRR